jgi:hypothetical protein
MSINTAEEIRKSVADRNMSVESLILRLQETNPSLSETEVGALAEAVRAVYDDEVQRASAAALQTIVNASKRDPRKLTDAATISRILPLVNMGAFKEEEVYNALADKFGLPTWSQENADKIESMAKQVQVALCAINLKDQEREELKTELSEAGQVIEELKNQVKKLTADAEKKQKAMKEVQSMMRGKAQLEKQGPPAT